MSMRKIVWGGMGLFLLLLALILFPSVWGARISANESGAFGVILEIVSAETSFQEKNQGKISDLSTLHALGVVKVDNTNNVRSGYIFSMEINGKSFVVDAIPVKYNKSGVKSFHADKNGTIHVADKQGNKATDADCVFGMDCGK